MRTLRRERAPRGDESDGESSCFVVGGFAFFVSAFTLEEAAALRGVDKPRGSPAGHELKFGNYVFTLSPVGSVPSARVDGGEFRDTDIGEAAADSIVLGCELDPGEVGPEVGGSWRPIVKLLTSVKTKQPT